MGICTFSCPGRSPEHSHLYIPLDNSRPCPPKKYFPSRHFTCTFYPWTISPSANIPMDNYTPDISPGQCPETFLLPGHSPNNMCPNILCRDILPSQVASCPAECHSLCATCYIDIYYQFSSDKVDIPCCPTLPDVTTLRSLFIFTCLCIFGLHGAIQMLLLLLLLCCHFNVYWIAMSVLGVMLWHISFYCWMLSHKVFLLPQHSSSIHLWSVTTTNIIIKCVVVGVILSQAVVSTV